MSEERKERCKTCRFWDRTSSLAKDAQKISDNESVGLCRRSFPQMTTDKDFLSATACQWPVTDSDDWCGEWKCNKPKPNDVGDGCGISLLELGLSVRATNVLECQGCLTVEDLTKRTATELLALSGFGPQSLREVERELTSRGLALRGNDSSA